MSKSSKIQTVKLREKPLKNGGVSLYLEGNSGGKTEKRYLNIHLTKGKSTGKFRGLGWFKEARLGSTDKEEYAFSIVTYVFTSSYKTV